MLKQAYKKSKHANKKKNISPNTKVYKVVLSKFKKEDAYDFGARCLDVRGILMKKVFKPNDCCNSNTTSLPVVHEVALQTLPRLKMEDKLTFNC